MKTFLLLALLLAPAASAQELAITSKGTIKLLKADGTAISTHTEVKEAYERVVKEGAGAYRIVLPEQAVVYSVPKCPVCPTTPPVVTPPVTPPTNPPVVSGEFNLPALAADPISGTIAKPARGGSYIDPAYGTKITRATQASDGTGSTMRHEYSRRQAFNANNTRYLALASNGYWHLYNKADNTRLRQLSKLAGDAEPIWSATNPRTLIYTSQNGGRVWWTKDVETDTDTVLFDFTGKTPWPAATSYWTKSEGTTSADGRYLALMATAYNSSSQSNVIYGLLVLDTQAKAIVSTLDASKWGGGFPDHISMSATGKYVVPSWAFQPTLGTRAYTRDFASFKQLHTQSEHSDLALGPNGEDFYVYTDYTTGKITAKNIDTLASFDLTSLYPASGAGYAAHISGQAFARPGWVVISTYSDFSNYSTSPATTLQPQYRKVFLAELKPGGKLLSLVHTRQAGTGYFDEPQASASRDLSLVIYASNKGAGVSDSYIATVPFK